MNMCVHERLIGNNPEYVTSIESDEERSVQPGSEYM